MFSSHIVLVGFVHEDLQGIDLRGWLAYAFGLALIFLAAFMVITRFCNQGQPADELKVLAPPPMNTMEQLLAVQNAIMVLKEELQYTKY